MITFVTYFVHFSENILKQINHVYDCIAQNGGYLPVKEPINQMMTMFESARKHHKNARLVLITDEKTEIELPEFIEVHRVPRETDKMEIEMIRAKIWALRNLGDTGHLIFLDSDMIIRDNLEPIFERDGSLFFTYAQLLKQKDLAKKNMRLLFPINIGFIAVKDNNKEGVAQFFEELIKQFSYFEDERYQFWTGLQFILRELFYQNLKKCEANRSLESLFFYHRWVRIEFLDAAVYNCNVTDTAKIPSEAKVLHFKGCTNKSTMFEYWKQSGSNNQKSED